MIKNDIEYRPRFAAKNVVTVCMLIVIVVGIVVMPASSTRASQQQPILSQVAPEKTIATNGASQWDDDNEITMPASTFSPPTSQEIDVSPLFARYYQDHNGINMLGEPLTAAFPTAQGWLQFFASGALLLPALENTSTGAAGGQLADMVEKGTKDPATGVVSLPLLQELLTIGSQVPVGGEGSTITYVDLRKAVSPTLMLPAPPTTPAHGGQSIFIAGGRRGGEDVGHFIPQSFWNYINRPDISPDGWMRDFGAPLTEALPLRVTQHGSTHRMLVQVFSHGGLVLDQDDLDASGQPTIQRLDTGTDYLTTFGPPTVVAKAQQTIWAQSDTPLLKTPGTGDVVVHVGQHFPLTTLGEASWTSDILWYDVKWTTPTSQGTTTGSGWISAAAITYTDPGNVPSWASFDVLSPALAAYLASNGSDVGAVVYDMTHQRYYTYNSNAQFLVASSIKVPIMLTFLDMIEQQQRQPTDDEMQLLTTMIENSDNDSATALYEEIGQGAAISAYMQKIGVTGLSPDDAAWGYSLITPQTMVNLLTDLQTGTILTAPDRTLALNLMENIESDQQVGVGDTAPDGALMAMKDGWVPGPDDLWAMNTSGIVQMGQEVYIVSVYTQEQPSLDDGQAIADHVCSALVPLLT